MALLIALVPALTWGLMATITTKLGGTAGQQTLGTSWARSFSAWACTCCTSCRTA